MNRSLPLACWLGVLAACGGGDDKDVDVTDEADADTDADSDSDTDTDTDADSDSDTDTDCTATIATVDPADAAVDVAPSTTVVVTFDQGITDAETFGITVDGVIGTTELASDGLSMTFTPDALLEAGTEYTVNAEVCGDTRQTTFTTSDAVDPALIEGRTYGLSWTAADLTVTEPPQGSALFFNPALFPIDYVMLQVLSIDPSTGEAPSAATIGYDEYGYPIPECLAVVEETGDFSANPTYTFRGDLVIVIDTGTMATADIEDFEMTGDFSADGSQILDVHLTGLVATEQFFDVSYALGGCNSLLAAPFNPTCVPCTISRQCMVVEMDAPVVNALPSLDLAYECSL